MSDNLDADVQDLMGEDPAVAALADQIVQTSPAFKRRDDPSLPHYPRGLVLDLVLKTAPVEDILAAYRIPVERFKELVNHPVFRREIRDMKEKVKEEGFSFRIKAQAQAEAYLSQAWEMVTDPETPANVRADLIKWTTKVASLEPKPDAGPQVAVNVDMRGITDEELKARVMSIVVKKAKHTVDGEAARVD